MGIGAAAVAGVTAAAGIANGIMSSNAASSAADKQATAARNAQQLQAQMFQTSQNNLQPYIQGGQQNLSQLSGYYNAVQPTLNTAYQNVQNATPQMMTQSYLESLPGYQFQVQQAQKAAQSSAAARGLGVSGAALKAAGTYGQNLANANYQTQFGNQQTLFGDANQQYLNALNGANLGYNWLSGPVQIGANAAANLANNSTTSANNQANNLISAGNAQANGILGAQQGINNAVNSVANGLSSYYGMNNASNILASLNNGGPQQNYIDSGGWDNPG